MSLHRFLDVVEAPSRSLVVLNRTAADPIQGMLEEAFERQVIGVEEDTIPDAQENVVILVEETGAGREVIATSPLEALQYTILMVNSDLYKTGASDLETFEMPDVLAGMEGVPFRLRGYPESEFEKLLLIVVSRYVEHTAWSAGTGTLRASFQRLSRINDERGTREVYDQLADSDVDTHIYGVPDWLPPSENDLSAHPGRSIDHRDSWFVLYTPPESATHDGTDGSGHLGLLAIEVEEREWEGFWTADPQIVSEIDSYVAENL